MRSNDRRAGDRMWLGRMWLGRKSLRSVAALAVMGTLVACTSAPDRAGGQATDEPMTLQFADPLGTPAPGVQAWLDAVGEAGHGKLGFEVHPDWALGQEDYEAQTIADVASGKADVGWVGARALDGVGVTSFQPLLAPFLVDSMDLEHRVFDEGLADEMLLGVDDAGVVGLAVLPGPMRKMLGINGPLADPGDFRGAVVGIQASQVAEWTFEALGASVRREPRDATLDGLDGLEQHTSSIMGAGYHVKATDLTGNLDFWPRPLVLIMNRHTYEGLSDAQRSVLEQAADSAAAPAWKAALAESAEGDRALCSTNLHVDDATEQSLEALRDEVQPVYDRIASDEDNAAMLDRIQRLKDDLAQAPDPVTCSEPAATSTPEETPIPDGTYRATLTREDTTCLGLDPDVDELVLDLTLDQGTLVQTEHVGGPDAPGEDGWPNGTYRVFRDKLQVFGDYTLTMHWSFDGHQLVLSDLTPDQCGDQQVWTSEPWTLQ